MLFNIVMVVILLYAVALLFIFPSREVSQPAGKGHIVWEALLPGVSPAWHVLSGLTLIVWCYLVLQDFFLFRLGSPRILTRIALPNLTKAYGVPGASRGEDLFKLINPSWVWVYLAPAVLFAVNLLLVLRTRRRA
ncbi:MAG: hypothetical protein ACYDA9_16730 [Terriglobia bacterium]